MKNPFLLPIVSLVVGSTIGYLVGHHSSNEPSTKTEAKQENFTHRRSLSTRSVSGRETVSLSSTTRAKSLSEAMAVPGENGRILALIDYFSGLTPSEFEEEANKIEDLPISDRMLVGHLLFSRWGEEDPISAMAYTRTMGFMGRFVSGTVMKSWASKSPQDAGQYYKDHPNEFRMSGMMHGRGRGMSTAGMIATEWVRQDREGAMNWALSLPSSDQGSAMKSIFSQVAQDDPEKALGMLSAVTDPDAQKSATNSLAYEWGKKSWTDAQSWISTLPEGQQSKATSRALSGLADIDPASAATYLSSLPEGGDRDNAMKNIAKKWARNDPASAAEWVMKNGSSKGKEESIGKVVASWVRQDPESAYVFVEQQPDGAVRDQSVMSYVTTNQGGDIQKNVALAETIKSDSTRRWVLGMTVRGWMKQDKEAATEYLNTTNSLSQRSKDRILERANR